MWELIVISFMKRSKKRYEACIYKYRWSYWGFFPQKQKLENNWVMCLIQVAHSKYVWTTLRGSVMEKNGAYDLSIKKLHGIICNLGKYRVFFKMQKIYNKVHIWLWVPNPRHHDWMLLFVSSFFFFLFYCLHQIIQLY